MIHGPPGTGKTTTLVALVESFVMQKKRVLVTAMSNTAVDNLLAKLADIPALNSLIVRVGHPVRI